MAETATATAAQGLVGMLKGCLEQTKKYIDKTTEEQRFIQLADGKATPLWLVGHMAFATDFLGNVLTLGLEPVLPADFNSKFSPTEFGGAAITTDPANYPSWEKVAKGYEDSMNRFIEAVSALTDDELPGGPKGVVPDMIKAMLASVQAGVALTIIHDSHHRGQIAMLVNQ